MVRPSLSPSVRLCNFYTFSIYAKQISCSSFSKAETNFDCIQNRCHGKAWKNVTQNVQAPSAIKGATTSAQSS